MSEEAEGESFNFDLFSEFMDKTEEEPKPIAKRNATEKEINQLCNFIGGFEKWSLLNEDCRREVIKYLGYKSRCNLSICSKIDYETVNKVPIYVHSIHVAENTDSYNCYDAEPLVSVKVQFDDKHNSENFFEIVFSQLGEDTVVQWLKFRPKKLPEKKNITIESSNYREEAVKSAEKWMAKCNYEVRKLSISMKNYPFETSKIKSLPYCMSAEISADNTEEFRWWMGKLPEENLDIDLSTTKDVVFSYPSDILACPQVMNAACFNTWETAEFTDDQFLSMKAKRVMFRCVNITEDGINRFLKHWVNGKSAEGFESALLWSKQARDELKIIIGIEVRPWDDDFRRDAAGFCFDYERCCASGSTYQIKSRKNPFESLTLCMSDDRVTISATGKKMIWNGKPYTSYSIP